MGWREFFGGEYLCNAYLHGKDRRYGFTVVAAITPAAQFFFRAKRDIISVPDPFNDFQYGSVGIFYFCLPGDLTDRCGRCILQGQVQIYTDGSRDRTVTVFPGTGYFNAIEAFKGKLFD